MKTILFPLKDSIPPKMVFVPHYTQAQYLHLNSTVNFRKFSPPPREGDIGRCHLRENMKRGNRQKEKCEKRIEREKQIITEFERVIKSKRANASKKGT
jgi:hypothetical protein